MAGYWVNMEEAKREMREFYAKEQQLTELRAEIERLRNLHKTPSVVDAECCTDKGQVTMTDRFAPPDKIWVCVACGKLATDRYGMEGWRSYGWDESCMLNSVLDDRAKHPAALEGAALS